MPIQYVGGVTSGRAGNTGTQAQSLTALTGGIDTQPREGDLVIVNVAVGTASGYVPTTLAISELTARTMQSVTTVTNYTYQQVSWGFMSASPLTSITIPSSGNARNAQRWTVQVWRGVDQTNGPLFTDASGTASGRPNPPSVTPVQAGSWIVWLGSSCAATGTAYTAPTDFATNWLGGTTVDTYDCMQGAGYYTGWASGAYDPAAITAGGTANAIDSWLATTVVLRIAPITVGVTEYSGMTNGKGYFAGGQYGQGSLLHLLGFTYATEVASTENANTGYQISDSQGFSSDIAGYFPRNGYIYTEVRKLVYPGTTMSNLANGLAVARGNAAGATYGTARGYTAGGLTATDTTTTDIEYLNLSTDTANNISAVLATSRGEFSGVHSSTNGYFAGGANNANTLLTDLDGITFATDTATNPAAALATARSYPAAVQSSAYGYWVSGYTGDGSSEVDGITFSNDAAVNPAAALSQIRYGASGISSPTKGYISGGGVPFLTTSTNVYNSIEALTFSSVTMAALGATLPYTGAFRTPVSGPSQIPGSSANHTQDSTVTSSIHNVTTTQAATATDPKDADLISTNQYASSAEAASSGHTQDVSSLGMSAYFLALDLPAGSKHYNLGGINAAWTAGYTEIDCITHHNDAMVNTTASMGNAVTQAPVGYSSTAGYTLGGRTYSPNAYLTAIEKFITSTEVRSTPAAVLGAGTYGNAAVSSSSKSYSLGGLGFSDQFTQYALTHSNDSIATQSTTLSDAKSNANWAESSTKGWLFGGTSNTSDYYDSSGYHLTFSTETYAVSTVSLTRTRTMGAVCVSENKDVYFCGGGTSNGTNSNIDKFSLTTETSVTSLGAASDKQVSAGLYQGSQSSIKGYVASLSGAFQGLLFTSETVFQMSAALATARLPSRNGLVAGTASTTISHTQDSIRVPAGIVADRTETASPAHSDNVFFSRETNDNGVDPLPGTSGYLVGGTTDTNKYAEALRFATETTVDLGYTYTYPERGQAHAWSSAAGYFAGGNVIGLEGSTTAIRRIRFDDETVEILTALISYYEFNRVGVSSDSKGYFGGGLFYYTGFIEEWDTDIDAFSFGPETALTIAATMTTGDEARTVVGMSFDKRGYYLGDTSNKYLNFSTEAMVTLSASASDGIIGPRSAAVYGKNGYMIGGWNAGRTVRQSKIIRFKQATETRADTGTSLATPRGGTSCVYSLENAYLGGGAGSTDTTIERFDPKTETVGSVSGTLQVARNDVYGGSQNLATKTQDNKTKAVPYYPYLTESTGGTADGADGTVQTTNQNADKTEAASAGHTDTVLAEFVAAQTESGSPVDTKTVVAAFVAAQAQAGTAADAPNATWGTASATTQAGAATDAPMATQGMANAITESGAAQDAKTVLAVFVAAQTDAASGGDTPTAIAQFVADTTQAGSATDTSNFGTATARDVTETAAAADSHSALAQFVAAIAQAGSAGAVQDVLRALYAAQAEAAAADSVQAALAQFVAAQTDPAVAADAATVAALFASATAESGAALAVQDYIAGMAVAHDAAASGADQPSVVAQFVAAVAEAGSAADTKTVLAQFLTAITEAGTGTDVPAALAQFVAAMADPAAADDTKTVTTAVPAAKTEPATATDTADATQYSIYAVSRDEPASATDTEAAVAVLVATFTDPANATDTQDGERNNLTIPASRDETASASEVGSATAALAAAQAESGASAELATALAALLASTTEPATATATASGTFIVAGANSETAAATALQVVQLEQSAAFDASLAADSTQSVLAVLFADHAEAALAGEQVTSSAVFYVMGDEAAFAAMLAGSGASVEAWIAEAAAALAAATGDTFANLYEQIVRVFVKAGINRTFVATAAPRADAQTVTPQALAATATPSAIAKTTTPSSVAAPGEQGVVARD